jgi:hypothetical protein
MVHKCTKPANGNPLTCRNFYIREKQGAEVQLWTQWTLPLFRFALLERRLEKTVGHIAGSPRITCWTTSIHILEAWWLSGRHGGSVVACLTVVLQSRVRIRHLPSPQLTANLLVGCHLGWHLAAGWPLCGVTEEKIIINELLVRQKHIEKIKFIIYVPLCLSGVLVIMYLYNINLQ